MTRTCLLFALLTAVGCRSGNEPRATCEVDEDCATGLRCLPEPDGAFCGCPDDDACDEGFFCNSAAQCQRRMGCRSNSDCGEGTFCHLRTGTCLPADRCGDDVHCAPGSVCVAPERGCTAGCYEDGDCSQYEICDDSQADQHPDGLGVCKTGCRSHAACPLGARCVGGQCFDSPNESHCAVCSEDRDCPFRTDWCLINPAFEPGRPEYGTAFQCAVDCADRPDICPSGYRCSDVVRLTDDPCGGDAECPFGRGCVIGEGDSRGFCACAADEDCSYQHVPATCTLAGCLYPPGRLCGQASDCERVERCGDYAGTGADVCYRDRNRSCESFRDCLCVDGACVRSGRPCSSWEDCNPTCESGRCRIGSACSPDEGLYCPDLR